MTRPRLALAIERARSRGPVTWLTLIGVLLLPVIIGGILVTALYNPAERLDGLGAAIVNDDQAVTIDGQLVPLGRQLTAGLVEGSDDLESNLNWTISNEADAAAGLADGTYAAVITIPENFSAAATSTRPGETPEQATIEVTTPPDSLIVDDAIAAQVTQAAASVMGEQLSTIYLENVFLGFTTLGDQLGGAADGAQELANGAQQAATGSAELPGGASQLASGARELSSGAGELGTGLGTIAGGVREASSGASQLAAGLDSGAAQIVQNGLVPAQITDLAAQTAATAQASADAAAGVLALADACVAEGAPQAYCDQLVEAATGASAAASGTAQLAGGTSQAVGGLAAALPGEIAGQFTAVASNVRGLADGLTQLAGGVDQSAAGAQALSGGASQLGDGADQLATGAQTLSGGVQQLADGTGELATGLRTAADSVPTYTDAEATSLASVVANPVGAEGVGTTLFGASAIPLLSMLALWFGGLASFVALQAVSRRALTSRAASALLAARGLGPAAALGALQGVLVAGVVQLAAGYGWAEWSVFAGLCVAAGVAFAAVNQSLVAVFGGAGRWVSAVIGVLAVATGVVSTVPGVLSQVASVLPTAPAYNGMVAALTSATGVGAALAGLAIWTLLAFTATVIAVARRRTTSVRALLEASPVTG